METKNRTQVKKVSKIQRQEHYDWLDELSNFEKKEIESGLADIEQGNTVDHSEVRKIYKTYL